jgi:hypothetical protein
MYTVCFLGQIDLLRCGFITGRGMTLLNCEVALSDDVLLVFLREIISLKIIFLLCVSKR